MEAQHGREQVDSKTGSDNAQSTLGQEGRSAEIVKTFQEAVKNLDFAKLDDLSRCHPRQVASLAYDWVDGGDGILQRLLFHPPVLQALIQDLPQQSSENQGKMASALLMLGHKVPLTAELDQGVKEMLWSRYQRADDYYIDKFNKHKINGPYLYKSKQYGDEKFNLNGKITRDKQGVVCRHLDGMIGVEYASESQTGHKEFLRQMKGEKPGPMAMLPDHTFEEMENLYRENKKLPNVILKDANFGHFIADLQSTMKEGESRSFSVLVTDSLEKSHAMRLFVEKKSSTHEKGAGMIRVGVYDPNVTANIRHIQKMPEDLRSLKLSDFLKPGDFSRYTRKDVALVIGVSRTFSDQSMFRYVGEDLKSLVLGVRDVLGHDGDTRNMAARLNAIANMLETSDVEATKEEIFSWLNDTLFVSALRKVLDRTSPEVIQAMSRFLKATGLASSQLKNLLEAGSANHPDGFLFVVMNLEKVAPHYLTAMGNLLSGLNLNTEDKTTLMLAPRKDGNSLGLLAALEKGDEETVKAYLSLLTQLGINDQAFWRQLLTQRDDEGSLLLFQVCSNPNAVQRLKEILMEAGLDGLSFLKGLAEKAMQQGDMQSAIACHDLLQVQ